MACMVDRSRTPQLLERIKVVFMFHRLRTPILVLMKSLLIAYVIGIWPYMGFFVHYKKISLWVGFLHTNFQVPNVLFSKSTYLYFHTSLFASLPADDRCVG